jgi:hypothetical protein
MNTNTISDLNNEIRLHEEAIKALREKLKAMVDNRMTAALENAASQQNVKVLCEHPRMIVVKASQVLGNPWNMEFVDWKSGANILIKWFEFKKLAPEKWYSTLKELYDNRKDNNRVDLPFRECAFGSWVTRKTPISAEFVKSVLDELEK